MTKPSAGALRAAKRFHEQGGSLYRTDEELARIIDQETGLPELVEALHGVYALFGHLLTDNSPPETNAEIIAKRRDRLKNLLLKAESREGT